MTISKAMYKRGTTNFSSNISSTIKSVNLSLCWSIAFKNRTMQLGRRQLSRVCHAITVQNSRTFCQMEAKRFRKKRCTRFDMGNIMPGCRYEQTPNLSQIASVNISHGLLSFAIIWPMGWVCYKEFLAKVQSLHLTLETAVDKTVSSKDPFSCRVFNNITWSSAGDGICLFATGS